ncbi:hypothetical protein [Paraburkholderia sp. 2C]
MHPTHSTLLAETDRQKAQLDAARPLPEAYYRVLDEACVTDVYDGISILVAQAVQRALALYLRLIVGSAGSARQP